MDDETRKLDLNFDEQPYKGKHRQDSRKKLIIAVICVAVGLVVLMTGVLLNMGGNPNKPIAHSKPIIGEPTSPASPTKKPTKSPSPTPTRTKTPTPTATPVAPTRSTVPSSKPTRTSKPAPAKCVVRALKPKFEGKNYEGKNAVKALLKQNMAWNDIYYGEFDFPSQKNKRQDMNELYNWMDGDRHERAAFDFFSLYHYNEGMIVERLKNVTGACKELADLDG
jgi:hypothetical protein